MGFGDEDIIDEFESSYISGFHYFQACSNQEEDIVPQVIDTPAHDETGVYDTTYLESLHHASGFDDTPPYSNLKEVVFCEGTDHPLEIFSLPSFLMQEGDTIDDTPSQEIIVETLHHETMVMLSSQPMIPMLCQVVPYQILEENDEHKER